MPTVLKIGYNHYIVKNDAAAAAVMKAMIGAVLLDAKHLSVNGKLEEFYWPHADRQTQVGIEEVPLKSFLRSEPTESDVHSPAALKQLGVSSQKLLNR